MRVIAGSAKGKKLKAPKKSKIRPLSDQAKEALFNILQPRVAQSYFLDLFAGTGSVAIEALSRRAKLAFLVELDRKHVSVIRENLNDCGFADRAEVYALDVFRALKILKKKQAKFDIIFIGAPYGSQALKKVLVDLGESDLLNQTGIIVAEHRKQHQIGENYGSLQSFREAKYGETVLTFYEKSDLSR